MIDLEILGVYELREYARSLGIRSPTIKKRAQLISEIKLMLSSNLPEEEIAKSYKTKGRPPKKTSVKLQNKSPLFKIEYFDVVKFDEELHKALEFEINKFLKRINIILNNCVLKIDNDKNKNP